jgi:AcrR family transcriptional regulator
MNTRKRQIIHEARQLFIDKGFNDTSILDIISAANISKGTFYNHFTSKNECLIAILEETREEVVNERYKVAINEVSSDINVLIKQISLLAYVNRKRNLMQIFESLAGNTNKEIKAVLNKHIISEIKWLAERLVDIFGEEIREISYECSVQAIGMMKQSLHITAIATKQRMNPDTVVKVVLGHVDAMIPRLLETKNTIITANIAHALLQQVEEKTVSKESLIEQLQGFIEKLTDADTESGIQLANYLFTELQMADEKLYVLESILTSFNNSFRNTLHEAEAHEISITFWRYLHMKKDMKS